MHVQYDVETAEIKSIIKIRDLDVNVIGRKYRSRDKTSFAGEFEINGKATNSIIRATHDALKGQEEALEFGGNRHLRQVYVHRAVLKDVLGPGPGFDQRRHAGLVGEGGRQHDRDHGQSRDHVCVKKLIPILAFSGLLSMATVEKWSNNTSAYLSMIWD
ncbi:unnamed protein product [Zymoseptoria tritici ST99CH_3D1]|nr:unnamed protein product [Zymoseptoria tritici ST99CH_3D1]